MTQSERRLYLIGYLMKESGEYSSLAVPPDEDEQWKLLRALMNVRPPKAVSQEFLTVQDAYLRKAIGDKGIVDIDSLKPVTEDIYIWQGDITTLRCDAIVNAANSGMTGCYHPLHGCIDNVIHTYAGIELRLECAEIMRKQGHEEEPGKAKITKAYNLPSEYVIHTVGPIVQGMEPTENDCQILASCYRASLEIAKAKALKSIAFCCISTGEFHFPNEKAAEIAISTVNEFLKESGSRIKVVFCVFKDKDRVIYETLLGKH